MESALHIRTKVLPGRKIEIDAPDLIEGELWRSLSFCQGAEGQDDGR